MPRGIGSGESGVVYPDGVTELVYKADLTESQVWTLYDCIAERLDTYPELEFRSPNTKWLWGRYYSVNETIRLYKPWPGVLIHEFAHHYHKVLGCRPVHNKMFYGLCTQLWEKHIDQVLDILTGRLK